MAQVTGPTIPRWQLGAKLRALRVESGKTIEDVMAALGCSESKVHKMEAGDVRVSRADLTVMMDMYGGTDSEERDHLYELQKLGQQRGWWAQYGSLPGEFSTYLDLEAASSSIRAFEPLVVYGLLQTEGYARANAETASGPIPQQDIERQVKIRMERQQRFFDSSRSLWVVLDEAVLRRPIGGAGVMRQQLEHLLELPHHRVTLQVVPFSAGGYPGTVGAVTIVEFQETLHSPVVYVECRAGWLYQERAKDVERASMLYQHMTASALSPADSRALIADVAQGL